MACSNPGGAEVPAEKLRVDQSARATLSNGAASVSFGPVPIGLVWEIDYTTITCDSLLRSTCQVYKGITNTGSNLIDVAPQSGNSNQSDTSYVLMAGEVLTIAWTGGDTTITAPRTGVCTAGIIGWAIRQ